MIHPDNKISAIWNVMLAVLLLYTAIIMPYRMAFIEPVWGDTWFFIELSVDALFMIDVIVNLLSAFYDSEHELVIDREIIFMTYLKSWMLFDIVACIPINLIESLVGQEEEGDN